MTSHPFLLFPASPASKRDKRHSRSSDVRLPSAERQRELHENKLLDLAASFDHLTAEIGGHEPERVVVFETVADNVSEFAKAASKVRGLEWVAELDLGDQASDQDFVAADELEQLPRRLYAVMASQRAVQKLLSLWRTWQDAPARSWVEKDLSGFADFRKVFQHLKDIRRWGPRDRLEQTGILDDWREEQRYCREHPNVQRAPIRFEIELWCRLDAAARRKASQSVETLVSLAGGRCLAQAAIHQIFYHGILAELPAEFIEHTLESLQSQDYTDLLRCEDIMFFRHRGQSFFPLGEPSEEFAPSREIDQDPLSPPVVAVLDGLPLENHRLLARRLQVDDPNSLADKYRPSLQQHGTAICSLIVHGDLTADEPPLTRALYVQPILQPATTLDGGYSHECTPDDVLLVDHLHRAVRRMFESDGDHLPAAPHVKVVNLSFGNHWQPFEGQFSPLARLLDWLSFKYRLLFIVSAGNQGQDITISIPSNQWKTLTASELQDEVIRAMHDDQANRRPLSPAESLNAITVGAWHEDGCPTHSDSRVDLFANGCLPSPFGTVAAGHMQSIKPEVYFPGGRQLYRGPLFENSEPATFKAVFGSHPPGLKVAAPGLTTLELDRAAYSRGTSDATALATRSVAMAYEKLDEYRRLPGWNRLTDSFVAVVLKALLVHGAAWGREVDVIESAIPADALIGKSGKREWQRLQRILHRFVGCGKVDPRKGQFATDERATVIGWGNLVDGGSHLFYLPLPPSLGSKKVWRRLVVTLAWFSPVNSRHRNYRKASLWASVDGVDELAVGKAGADEVTSGRGTVQHRVWEGDRAAVFEEDGRISIRVNCRAVAGKMRDAVPYALVVSLEVAEGVGIPVYQEVRDLVAIPIRPRVR